MLLRVRRFVQGLVGSRELSLQGVTERTKVHVLGTIASPNQLASPVTPVRAAVLTWALMHKTPTMNQSGASHADYHYRPFASRTLRQQLVIETPHGTLLVPTELSLDTRYATPIDRNPQPLLSRPPPELMAMMEDRSGGEVYYGERFLVNGDRVAVQATVEPVRATAGPYRGIGADTDFVVTQAETATLTEQSR